MPSLLRFKGGPANKVTVQNTGPWPPPLRVAAVCAGAEALLILALPDEVDTTEDLPSDAVTYRRTQMSDLSPNEHAHIAPGAVYEVEDGSWRDQERD